MEIDHIAYRVKDRIKAAKYFCDALNYKIQEEFDIDLGEENFAKCIVLYPPENIAPMIEGFSGSPIQLSKQPEIFISDGSEGSIIGDWVKSRGGIGGVHHIAYRVKSVEAIMKEWKEKGYAEFTTEEPMKCEGLTQAFTKPSEIIGVIIEVLERSDKGFCKDNVSKLMLSTKGL